MNGSVFVDTNVLVYARDASEPAKQPRAHAWLQALWQQRSGRLSMQVLQEYYVTVTRKLKPGLPPEAAREDVRSLTAWQPLAVTPTIMAGAWTLQDRYELSFWDALVVSAAQSAGCETLLTEDLQDEQVYGDLRVRNPFTHLPPERG